jgi:hypothetical protein
MRSVIRLNKPPDPSRRSPSPAPLWRAMIEIDGKLYDARIVLGPRPLQLGESREADVQFLAENVVARSALPGKEYRIIEGHEVGSIILVAPGARWAELERLWADVRRTLKVRPSDALSIENIIERDLAQFVALRSAIESRLVTLAPNEGTPFSPGPALMTARDEIQNEISKIIALRERVRARVA